MTAGDHPLGGSRGELTRVGESGPAYWLVLDSFGAANSGAGDAIIARIASNGALARALGDDETAMRCREIMVKALAAAGRPDDSIACAENLMEHYRSTGQSASRLQVLGQIIVARLARGDFERALDELTDALVELSRLGELTMASARALVTVANAASSAEMFEMASSQLRRATQVARRLDDPSLSRLVDSTIARNELRLAASLELLGRPDEATARYREALRAAVRTQAAESVNHWRRIDWRRIGRLYEGYAWASLGEPELGRVALLEALGRNETAMDPEDTLILRLGLSRVCTALGLADEGRAHLQHTSGMRDATFSHQWQVAIMLQAAEVERVQHGEHPGIGLATDAARLLANSLWEERERRLEAVIVRMQMLDLAAENERVSHVATEDPLTGLGNRRRLDAALVEMGEDSPEPACVLFIDIDKFKGINDMFSHAIGDEVLKTVADVLRHESRDGDVLIRYGGDEFVVVLRDTSSPAAARVGERIRAAVATHPWWRTARGLETKVSVGVAEHVMGMTYDEVIGAADAALYEAKRLGRDRIAVA
jgi:diguanylate cyclase (GGDEF)-like protein